MNIKRQRVNADRIVWKWTDEDSHVHRVTNRFTVLSVRLFGDVSLDGAVDDDDRAAEPGLSETYGWGIPVATNVFRPVRLSTQSHLDGVYTLSLEGTAGAIKIWATGSPGSGDSPLLACGQTVTDGVNGASFAGYPGCDVYVEAVSNGHRHADVRVRGHRRRGGHQLRSRAEDDGVGIGDPFGRTGNERHACSERRQSRSQRTHPGDSLRGNAWSMFSYWISKWGVPCLI